jgi:hypothetical protein
MADFWKIEESVGFGYIVWPGSYSSREEAELFIAQVRFDTGKLRARPYQTGRGSNGPERLEMEV